MPFGLLLSMRSAWQEKEKCIKEDKVGEIEKGEKRIHLLHLLNYRVIPIKKKCSVGIADLIPIQKIRLPIVGREKVCSIISLTFNF